MFNLFRKKPPANSESFDIISLLAGQHYFPASLEGKGGDLSGLEGLLDDEILATIEIDIFKNSIKHTEVDLGLGQSRYGGPILDIPLEFNIPENLHFAAQLDLHELSKHDKSGILPNTGHLYFFSDIRKGLGKVFYEDVPNYKLTRVFREHEDDFFTGVVIEGFLSEVEKWTERFKRPEDKWEEKHANKAGLIWDEFGGADRSKLFGIFTHCQMSQKEIENMTNSDKILLLQIGEKNFNDEGVFSVLIPKNDLAELNFKNCEFYWSQS